MECFNRKKDYDQKLKNMCFPEILMEVLSDDLNSDSISWLPHGLAFKMTNSKNISKRIIPKYFKTIKYSSFIRMINRWGFVRNTMGVNKGAYTHKLFQRENPKLCKQMTLKKAVKPTRKVSPTVKMVVTEEKDHKAQEIDVYRFLRLKANQLNGVQPAMKLVNEAQFHQNGSPSDDSVSVLTASIVNNAKRALLQSNFLCVPTHNISISITDRNIHLLLLKLRSAGTLLPTSSVTSVQRLPVMSQFQRGPSAA